MKYKYIVWVGDIDDHYDNYQQAFEALEDWVEKGYDDVILETVPENKIGRHFQVQKLIQKNNIGR